MVRTLGLRSLLLVIALVPAHHSRSRAAMMDDGKALAHTRLGEAELERGQAGGPDAQMHFDAAERALREALAVAPDSADAIHALSSVFMRTGRTEEAAELLRDGLVANLRSARLHAKLGYVLRYAGMMERSIEEYRLSQKLDGRYANHIAAERQIVKSLIYSGRYDEAFEAYGSILGWLSSLGEMPDEKVQFYQGLARLYAGDVDRAVHFFDASMASASDSLWSSFAEAYKYGALGERSKLRELADVLAKGNVSDGERRYRLAHLNAMADRHWEALAHLEASARSGFFNYPYSKNDQLLEGVEPSSELARILRFIENRHQNFVERNP